MSVKAPEGGGCGRWKTGWETLVSSAKLCPDYVRRNDTESNDWPRIPEQQCTQRSMLATVREPKTYRIWSFFQEKCVQISWIWLQHRVNRCCYRHIWTYQELIRRFLIMGNSLWKGLNNSTSNKVKLKGRRVVVREDLIRQRGFELDPRKGGVWLNREEMGKYQNKKAALGLRTCIRTQ